MQILRSSKEYRASVLSNRFEESYSIEMQSSTRAILKPKGNPSVLLATLFPMFKTRFKYLVLFDNKTGALKFHDLYALNFNRANGSTPEQQLRIQDMHHKFKSSLEKAEAQIEHDRDEVRRLVLAGYNDKVKTRASDALAQGAAVSNVVHENDLEVAQMHRATSVTVPAGTTKKEENKIIPEMPAVPTHKLPSVHDLEKQLGQRSRVAEAL